MSELVKLLKSDSIILVESSGNVPIEEWQRSLRRVKELSEKTGIRLVLVDSRKQTSAPNTGDILEFGNSLPRNLKFAIIYSLKTKQKLWFLKIIAAGEGDTVDVFEKYDTAVDWLKGVG